MEKIICRFIGELPVTRYSGGCSPGQKNSSKSFSTNNLGLISRSSAIINSFMSLLTCYSCGNTFTQWNQHKPSDRLLNLQVTKNVWKPNKRRSWSSCDVNSNYINFYIDFNSAFVFNLHVQQNTHMNTVSGCKCLTARYGATPSEYNFTIITTDGQIYKLRLFPFS